MTNKEFYGDRLLAVVLKGNCDALYRMVHGKSCTGVSCGDCEFGITKESEIEKVLKWLNAEHVEPEPPLLENGDGLKPGDWIMVRDRDDQKWAKCTFICYLDGRFWTTPTEGPYLLDQLLISGWKQARLPMEDE